MNVTVVNEHSGTIIFLISRFLFPKLRVHETFSQVFIYPRLKVKGTFFSESTDAFVISSNMRTFYFPELENFDFGD